MKKLILIISVLVCLEYQTFAQKGNEAFQYNKMGSLVWISLNNGAVLGKGLLWKVSEDTLEFVNLYYKNKNPNLVKVTSLKLHYSEIKELKTTPRVAIKKGMLTGAAIGLVSGLAVGMATTENPAPYTVTKTSPEFCFILCFPASTYNVEVDDPRDAGIVIIKTLIMTGVGTMVGGILGNSAAIKETTEGSKEKYQALVPDLMKQAFWGPPEVYLKNKK